MAPVVLGLDLAELKWSKFKSSYMWNKDYHLRRTKFIVYQCALIFCVVSESLGTDVLSDYIQGERKIQTITANRVKVYNNDYVGAGSYNIFAGVFVAFIFGAAFFFDLFWPERREIKGVRIAWKVCGVLATIFHLAAALALTIITATHRSYIRAPGMPGPPDEQFWWSHYKKYSEAPLVYRHNARAIAAVVFVWLGWVSVAASCVLLFRSIAHTEQGPGPKSKHARARDGDTGREIGGSEAGSDVTEKDMEKPASEPDPTFTPAVQPGGPLTTEPVTERPPQIGDVSASGASRAAPADESLPIYGNMHTDGTQYTAPAAEYPQTLPAQPR